MRKYIFTWPHDTAERLERFVRALEGIGMATSRCEENGYLNIRAQFRNKAVTYEDSLPIILPILQRFRIPDFAIDDGDLTVIDNKGDIISWCDGDVIGNGE